MNKRNIKSIPFFIYGTLQNELSQTLYNKETTVRWGGGWVCVWRPRSPGHGPSNKNHPPTHNSIPPSSVLGTGTKPLKSRLRYPSVSCPSLSPFGSRSGSSSTHSARLSQWFRFPLPLSLTVPYGQPSCPGPLGPFTQW